MTTEEESTTVKVMANSTVDPAGQPVPPTNVRFTEFGQLPSDTIIGSLRYVESLGIRDDADRNQAFIEQLVLDRCGCRIENLGAASAVLDYVAHHPLESLAIAASIAAIPATGGGSTALAVALAASTASPIQTCSEAADAKCVFSVLGTVGGAGGATIAAGRSLVGPGAMFAEPLLAAEAAAITVSLGFSAAALPGVPVAGPS